MISTKWRWTLLTLTAAGFAGCVNVHVDPIVATVNVNVKIDRQLDDFFSYQQNAQPATAPSADTPAVVVPAPTTIPNPQ